MKCSDIINRHNISKSSRYIKENGLAAFLRKLMEKLSPDLYDIRRVVAGRYLGGIGIEIGAMHKPLALPRAARVKYVDRWPAAELRKRHPELDSYGFVNVDIIDDGEKLDTIERASQDFVVANHFLEHCENPIGAVRSMLSVLKNGGILYLAVPDKRYTFDRDRPRTPIEHLLRDFEEGPAWSKAQHVEEWVRSVIKPMSDAEAQSEITRLTDMNYSIHCHVWTQEDLLELVLRLKNELNFGFELELFLRNDIEIIMILKKGTDAGKRP